MKIYGIKNCTSVRNALTFLDKHNLKYEFIDYKKTKIEASKLKYWMAQLGQNVVYNHNSAMFKKLGLPTQIDEDGAIALCQKHPNIIKRPILEVQEDKLRLIVGFDKAAQAKYKALVKD